MAGLRSTGRGPHMERTNWHIKRQGAGNARYMPDQGGVPRDGGRRASMKFLLAALANQPGELLVQGGISA